MSWESSGWQPSLPLWPGFEPGPLRAFFSSSHMQMHIFETSHQLVSPIESSVHGKRPKGTEFLTPSGARCLAQYITTYVVSIFVKRFYSYIWGHVFYLASCKDMFLRDSFRTIVKFGPNNLITPPLSGDDKHLSFQHLIVMNTIIAWVWKPVSSLVSFKMNINTRLILMHAICLFSSANI